MAKTAFRHFQDDIERASALVSLAKALPAATDGEKLLRDDLLRSGWMFAVGALDAYFCDAYTDLVAATIIAKGRYPAMNLPEFFYEIRFPIRAILEEYDQRDNWRWRMAARKMMERENVLKLEEIRRLFNKFFRKGHKFFSDLLDAWIVHPSAMPRLFAITQPAYASLDDAGKDSARKAALQEMEDRFSDIFQRRHDCIHNCDRPRVSPQVLASPATVLKVIADVGFLVERCDEHIRAEFRQFLLDAGCSSAIVSKAGY